MPALRDLGWVWEGQGFDPGVPPSIYGLGQGAAYFGLTRVNYLFHPNDDHALRLLAHLDEVTCDISKWSHAWLEDGSGVRCVPNAEPNVVRREARNVAELSRRFPNVTGAFDDDLMGLMRRHGMSPAQFGDVRRTMRELNRDLKLWAVVYTHELDEPDFWRAIAEHIDVVNLWIWESKNLRDMPARVDACARLFPDKPIVMGVYLRDYPIPAPVPVDRVRRQMHDIASLIDAGRLDGYAILGSVLIDSHRAQAKAVRDFIAES